MTDTTKDSPAYSTGAQILAAALRRQAAEEQNTPLKKAKLTFADKVEAAMSKGA